MVPVDSLGPRDHFAHVLFSPSGRFVRVLWVLAFLDPSLGPPGPNRPEDLVSHVFCECFVSASAIANALPMLFLYYPSLFNPILSYPNLSYPNLSYAILTYPILSYPMLSYPSLCYLSISEVGG